MIDRLLMLRRAPALLALAGMLSGLVLPACSARAAGSPPVLAQAQTSYANGDYDEAISTLLGAINAGQLTGTSLRDAQLLVGRCYVKKGRVERAKESFRSVLEAWPGYVPAAGELDDEELAVYRSLLPAPAPPATPPAGAQKPARTPAPRKVEPPPAAPPAVSAPAAPPADTTQAPRPEGGIEAIRTGTAEHRGWLGSHKTVAALIGVTAGAGIAALLAGGSSSSSPPPVGPSPLPAFPPHP